MAPLPDGHTVPPTGDAARRGKLTASPDHRPAGGAGDPAGGARTIFPHAYTRLRDLAAGLMRGEPSRRLLQATALVHEAFVRLSEGERVYANEQEFMAVAAAQMRRVLIDYARRARSAKRGGGAEQLTLDSKVLAGQHPTEPPALHRASIELLDVDDAINRLSALDSRQAKLAELHLFGGMAIPETAAVLGVSERTAFNDWRVARAWLLKELAP